MYNGWYDVGGNRYLFDEAKALGAGAIAAMKSGWFAKYSRDSDLLDGQHGSYYQPASTAINTGNIGSQSVLNSNEWGGINATSPGIALDINSSTTSTAVIGTTGLIVVVATTTTNSDRCRIEILVNSVWEICVELTTYGGSVRFGTATVLSNGSNVRIYSRGGELISYKVFKYS